MEQYIINKLSNILKLNINIKTLKYISYDNSNNEYLTHSKKTAIDFDSVKNLYNIKDNNNIFELQSNDALYIDKNKIHYFIEFKNIQIIKNKPRKIKKELQLKIYDSIFILSDIEYSNGIKYISDIFSFSKNYIIYILVYNSNKNSSLQIHNNLENKSKMLSDKLGLSKFTKFLLKEVYIYDEKEFEREFINKIIRNEP
ncbi:geranyl transferase [Brachyspira aalborgi]|uniref:geranyl transferase n=1 Tax=Brachyspira aalborgi TaxID=29522 RepID=UPI0011CBC99A|nr:geranyl transferase [Brachyspira aalborgi]TXJ43925.1 geranyl transferase [Brachyspira aalborgi]